MVLQDAYYDNQDNLVIVYRWDCRFCGGTGMWNLKKDITTFAPEEFDQKKVWLKKNEMCQPCLDTHKVLGRKQW